MRHILSRREYTRHLLRRFWLVLPVIVVGLTFLSAAYASEDADSSIRKETNEGLDSADTGQSIYARPAEATIAEPPMAAVEQAVQAVETLSYTLFLPWVTKGYWGQSTHSFGIQIFQAEPEVVTKTAQTGARWVRLPISWSWIEPTNTTPENYQWPASFEAGLERLAAQDFQIILTLGGNPGWAATYSSGPIDRTDLGELAEFLGAAVARYSVPPYNVKYWELYNEPDNGDELWASYSWGYWGNDPEAYAQMLAAVYQPMKAANPGIYVVFGGISFDNWVEEGGPFVKDFLDRVLQYGVGPYFDIMNFHYYPNYHAKWSPYGIGLIGKTAFLRAKLASFNLDKPIVCTETGSQNSAFNGGSDEEQSRYVVQTFTRGAAAGLGTVIWFKLQDDDGLGYWKTGLLNADLSPNPSFYAYQTLVDQLRATGYVRPIEPAEFGSEQIEGYDFLAWETSTRILAVWSQDELDHEMTVATGQLTVIDKYGGQTVRSDGDDGTLDGRVQVVIGLDPVYLRFSGNVQARANSPAPNELPIPLRLEHPQPQLGMQGIP